MYGTDSTKEHDDSPIGIVRDIQFLGDSLAVTPSRADASDSRSPSRLPVERFGSVC